MTQRYEQLCKTIQADGLPTVNSSGPMSLAVRDDLLKEQINQNIAIKIDQLKRENEQWFTNLQAALEDESAKRDAGDTISLSKILRVQDDVIQDVQGLLRISGEQLREELKVAVASHADRDEVSTIEALATQLIERCHEVEVKVEKCKEFQYASKETMKQLASRTDLETLWEHLKSNEKRVEAVIVDVKPLLLRNERSPQPVSARPTSVPRPFAATVGQPTGSEGPGWMGLGDERVRGQTSTPSFNPGLPDPPCTPKRLNQTNHFNTPQYCKSMSTEWFNLSETDSDVITPDGDQGGSSTVQFITNIQEKIPAGLWKSAVPFPRLNLDGKDRVWEMDEAYKRWRDGCQMSAATVNVKF